MGRDKMTLHIEQTPSHSAILTKHMNILVVRSRLAKLFEDDTQCPHTGVNVNPYEVHANSNVGSHNIAIGGTLGWSKQQQGQSKQQQYCQYSPDAERQMQGQP